MNVEFYIEWLRKASLEDLRSKLVVDLRCPIDWSKQSIGHAENIFLQKWFYMAADGLPNGEQDANVLRGDCCQYCSEPSDESWNWVNLNEGDARALAFNTFRTKDEFHKRYSEVCGKYVGLQAQSKLDRAKHYPISANTINEILEISRKNNDIGYLLPNLHPKAQIEFFWDAVHDAFERNVCELEEDGYDARTAFDKSWNDLFGSDQFRFCVNTMTTVGYYAGQEATWLIYDTSFHGKVTHCYPALVPLQTAKQTWLGSLQGLKEAFVEGRQDWP